MSGSRQKLSSSRPKAILLNSLNNLSSRGDGGLDHPVHLPQPLSLAGRFKASAGWMLMSYGGSVLGGGGPGETRRLILPTHSAHPCFANPQLGRKSRSSLCRAII